MGGSGGAGDPTVESEVHVGHVMSVHAPPRHFQPSNLYFQPSPQLSFQQSGNDTSVNPLSVPGMLLGHAPSLPADAIGTSYTDGEMLPRDNSW